MTNKPFMLMLITTRKTGVGCAFEHEKKPYSPRYGNAGNHQGNFVPFDLVNKPAGIFKRANFSDYYTRHTNVDPICPDFSIIEVAPGKIRPETVKLCSITTLTQPIKKNRIRSMAVPRADNDFIAATTAVYEVCHRTTRPAMDNPSINCPTWMRRTIFSCSPASEPAPSWCM